MWLFDLDDTLHDASHGMFRAIDARMTEYVGRHLEVERAEADRLRQLYWHRYGATLIGLIRHHGVDAHHFLSETHDFDVGPWLRAERHLARLLQRLPGRKILLTNAPRDYAGRIVRALRLHRHFRRQYTIERMEVHRTFRPKPSRSMLRFVLARERIGQGRAVLVEDSAVNLKAARSLGLRTVLLARHRKTRGRSGNAGRPTYIEARIASLHRLPAVKARLRA